MKRTFLVEIDIEGRFDADDLEYVIKAGFGEAQGGPYPKGIKVIDQPSAAEQSIQPKERPPAFVLGYLASDFITTLHERLLSLYLLLESQQKISKAEIARRLTKDPAVINRWLSGPGNWELRTVSDLSAAMGYKPEISFVPIRRASANGETQGDIRLAGQTIYLIYCGWDYEGGDIKAIVTTMEEAMALKEKYSDSEHYSYDEVRIDKWQIGDITDRRWEEK